MSPYNPSELKMINLSLSLRKFHKKIFQHKITKNYNKINNNKLQRNATDSFGVLLNNFEVKKKNTSAI